MVRVATQSLALFLLGACASQASKPPSAAPPVAPRPGETARAERATAVRARPSLKCRARYSTATFELEVVSLRASRKPAETAEDFERFEGNYKLTTGSTVRRGTMKGYRNGDFAFIHGTSDEPSSEEIPVDLMVTTLDAAANSAVTWTRDIGDANLFTCTGSLLTAPVDGE